MYALAACLLAAAVFATYRKSAMVAPAAVVLTLLYYRRRDLLKLAPLGMILLVTVMILSPGALSSIADQFTRSDATALPTVSDRSSDYDAIRPDVWSHLALGRGWGSYNHETYRILDSEILHRTIETGVFGLLAFLLLPIAVLATARRLIRSRDPTTAAVGLVGASVAVALPVLAVLFDVLSFPHVPYVFLYMTGLVAAVVAGRRQHGQPSRAGAAGRAEPRPPGGPLGAEDSLVPLR
jgi:O-antigen ligase